MSELEESLEQARDLIDQVLGIEEVDETEDGAAQWQGKGAPLGSLSLSKCHQER